MTGIQQQSLGMLVRLWFVAFMFLLLSIATNFSVETRNYSENTTLPVRTTRLMTTELPLLNATTESSLISHVNVTAVTGK